MVPSCVVMLYASACSVPLLSSLSAGRHHWRVLLFVRRYMCVFAPSYKQKQTLHHTKNNVWSKCRTTTQPRQRMSIHTHTHTSERKKTTVNISSIKVSWWTFRLFHPVHRQLMADCCCQCRRSCGRFCLTSVHTSVMAAASRLVPSASTTVGSVFAFSVMNAPRTGQTSRAF
jgi:hypothetical protein